MIRLATLSTAVGVTLLAATLLPVTAGATISASDVTPVSPTDGQVMQQPTKVTIPVTVRWNPPTAFTGDVGAVTLKMEVTNQNILGQDGTLADDDKYLAGQLFGFTRGDADRSSWTQTMYNPYGVPFPAGTYYFQITASIATYVGAPTSAWVTDRYTSPVYSFRVAEPAPVATPTTPTAPTTPTTPTAPVDDGSFALAAAPSILKAIIRDRTKRQPTMTRSGCRRGEIDTEVICAPTWSDSKYKYVGRIEMTRSVGDVSYGFEGWRATKSCLKKRTFKKCRSSVAWNG